MCHLSVCLLFVSCVYLFTICVLCFFIFRDHKVCPVTGCTCKCIAMDDVQKVTTGEKDEEHSWQRHLLSQSNNDSKASDITVSRGFNKICYQGVFNVIWRDLYITVYFFLENKIMQWNKYFISIAFIWEENEKKNI